MAEGKRDHDQPGGDAAGGCCCRSIPKARVYGAAGHQRPRRRRRRGLHARGRPRARRSARRGHGHRHQHRADPRASRPHPRRVVPGRAGVRGRRDLVRHAGARRRHRDGRGARRRHRSRSASSATGRPKGICGSGLVDLMSELLRTGRMNEMGRFEDGESTHHARRGARRRASSRATSTSWPRPRAPTSPGCRSCSTRSASTFDDIDVFYLAGGFGRHLRLESAQRIGLIPTICRRAIVQVGNAAIEGATHRAAVAGEARRARRDWCGASSTAGSKRIPASSTSSSTAASSSRSTAGRSRRPG